MAAPSEPGKPVETPRDPALSPAAGERPVRIAFLITELDPGGAERALVQLVTRLDRDRWDPVVFCLATRGPLTDELERADVRVRCFGAKSIGSVGVLPRLVAALRRERPALLQTWLYHANIAGRIAGRLASVPRIVAGIRVAEKRSRRRLQIDRLTQWMVDCHVCVSRGVADFAIQQGGLSAEKVLVIPNGVDFDRFAGALPADLAQFGIPAEAKCVLFVGRLDPQKAPGLLLDAALPLFERQSDLHLLYVGEGPLRALLEDRVREGGPGVAARVHFAGWQAEIPSLMKAATLLACPSQWEGMANVVLEAMAAGLPVVATDVEGMSEVIDHRRTGLLVDTGIPVAFREAVEELLMSPDRSAALAVSAQEIVREQFTWRSVVSSYEALYCSLIAGDPVSPRSLHAGSGSSTPV